MRFSAKEAREANIAYCEKFLIPHLQEQYDKAVQQETRRTSWEYEQSKHLQRLAYDVLAKTYCEYKQLKLRR
jgi:hypothetical protein